MTEQLPTHDEALRMLAAKAREGSVTAIVHLERLLRTQKAEQTRVRRCLIRGLRSQPGRWRHLGEIDPKTGRGDVRYSEGRAWKPLSEFLFERWFRRG